MIKDNFKSSFFIKIIFVYFIFSLIGASSVFAQSVKYSLRIRSRIKDKAYILRLARKRLQSQFLAHGFEVSRSVRKGYWFKITMSLQEMAEEGDPPSCVILLRLNMIILPERRMVMRASASGKAHFNRPTKMTRKLHRRLRKNALRYAVRSLIGNLRHAVARVEAKRRSLKKGQVLGTALKRTYRGGGKGRGSNKRLKKLNGRVPRLKMLAPSFDKQGGIPSTLSS